MWSEIIIPLLVGLSVFIFGMKVMELALYHWAGDYLKKAMERCTETPLRGMVMGTGMTALLQSSSAITVITIGMVNAGLLTFPRTLGIILGTNIGTCLTTELIGLNISHYAVPLLWSSFVVWFVSLFVLAHFEALPDGLKHALQTLRNLALALCGFSSILLGMEMMQGIVPALQGRGLFPIFVAYAQQSLIWGIIAGTILTAIIQSGSASVAIAMALAATQVIDLELGIAIILGSNIGTCITGLIASIGGTRAGRLVALSHVALNIGGAVIFYPLIPLFGIAAQWMADSSATQLAHVQTLYNVLCALIALPICYLPWLRRL